MDIVQIHIEMEGGCWPYKYIALVSVFSCCLGFVAPVERRYVNEWAAEIPGGPEEALALADELGYDYGGQVSHRKTLHHELVNLTVNMY